MITHRSIYAALAVLGLVAMTAAAPAGAQEIVLRAGHSAAESEPYHLGFERMRERLEESTGGRASLEIFPNSQLGNEVEMIEGVLTGTLDITSPANAPLTNFVPELKIFDMPFLFEDTDHFQRAMSGELIDELDAVMTEKGFKLLGVFAAGVRHIMTREKPVESIADLEGMKIRTMQSQYHISAFEAFGANPTALAYGELYGALQTGVVDGAEAANTNYHAQSFYEVAPNWALVGWTTLVAPVIMSQDRFAALPEDVRRALEEAAAGAAEYQRALYIQSDEERFEKLEAEGVTVTRPDPEPFREAARKVYDQYLTTELDQRLLQIIQDAADK